MSRASRDARGRAPLTSMITGGTLAGLGATFVISGIGLLVSGVVSAVSILGAGLAVVMTFVLGVLALAFILGGPGAQPYLSLPGALLVYTGQILVLVSLGLSLRGSPWVDGHAVAVGGIVTVVAWITGQIRGFATSRQPMSGVSHGVLG